MGVAYDPDNGKYLAAALSTGAVQVPTMTGESCMADHQLTCKMWTTSNTEDCIIC